MFFLCWEKDGKHNWEKCYKAKDIADVLADNELVDRVDMVYCLYGGYDGNPMTYGKLKKAVEGELPVKGSFVWTPRFLDVMLSEVYDSREAAMAAGFTEPTHAKSDYFDVLGKCLGNNRMAFAAAMK